MCVVREDGHHRRLACCGPLHDGLSDTPRMADGASLLEALPSGATEPATTLPYDLALIDLGLPGSVSGQDVIAYLRREHPALPVIAISASSTTLEEARERYTVPVMYKPFSLVALVQVIEKLPRGA